MQTRTLRACGAEVSAMRVNIDLQVPYLGGAVVQQVDAHHGGGGSGQAGHSRACVQPSATCCMQHISIKTAMRYGAVHWAVG